MKEKPSGRAIRKIPNFPYRQVFWCRSLRWERRLVEIARSLIINPKFLLLDEPFAGIDPVTVQEIQHIIQKLRDEDGWVF